MDNKSLRIKEVYNYFKDHPIFTYQELYDFYRIKEPQLKEGTYKSRVYNLKKANILKPIEKGIYELMKDAHAKHLHPSISHNDNYLVLTADIIDSKKNEITQQTLNDMMSKLNEYQYETNSIIIPFSSSRGDEFQTLTYVSPELPAIIRNIRYIFHPIKIRIGIGIGTIENEHALNDIESPYDSWNMSGEAFFNARHALEQLKNSKSSRVLFHSSKPQLDQTFNLIYKLIDVIVSDWSDKQWEAIQLYDKVKSYESGGKKLGISKSSFYQRCAAAKWDTINEVETELNYMLIRGFK